LEFGDIVVEEGKDVVLFVNVANGKFDFTGSFDPEEDHTIKGRFSDITLTIPEDIAFTVSAETRFGTITTEFPIMIIGEMDPQNLSGDINGGGPSLTIKTENGNITLNILNEIKE
jgi:hypothetical protein